jgi:exosome complex component RRP46
MNKAYMEVSYRPRCGIPGVNERYKEKIIKNICETVILTALYPKSQINIQIQEMDDGSGVIGTDYSLIRMVNYSVNILDIRLRDQCL